MPESSSPNDTVFAPPAIIIEQVGCLSIIHLHHRDPLIACDVIVWLARFWKLSNQAALVDSIKVHDIMLTKTLIFAQIYNSNWSAVQLPFYRSEMIIPLIFWFFCLGEFQRLFLFKPTMVGKQESLKYAIIFNIIYVIIPLCYYLISKNSVP